MSENKTEESTTIQVPQPRAMQKAPQFRSQAMSIATSLMSDWLGSDRARESAGRLSVALAAARASSKNPTDFDSCTPESIGRVIALCALTNIMPSTGAGALAYVIPRKVSGVQQLNYQLSHRGINALANRAGMHMIAIPIGHNDMLRVDPDGSCVIEHQDLDNPPTTIEDLRGVVLIVKNLKTGIVIHSGFVAKKLILDRRETSDGWKYAEKPGKEYAKESDPWHRWPVEQSQKTAMHYAVGRGWCVIDDTESSLAISQDSKSDVIDAKFDRKGVELIKYDAPEVITDGQD
jgi:recombinational DNA repair protein RecT